MIYKSLILLLGLVKISQSIPVDNGVVGEPEIECGPTSITINFNTKNEFEGHTYVKGLYDEVGCRNDEGGRAVAGINLPFDSCSVRRQRSLNPKGIFVSTTVIISFHPLFVTKVDRAYKIQCFYMEADKTVSTDLEVSMLTTVFRTENVPMPICRYELLSDATGAGGVVEFATVGQTVYHKWSCDTETIDSFCMIVHSCFVDDTNGEKVDLIDEEGCASDRYLLNNPEYLTDLMAGVEAHAFKFADRASLYFQCQLSILVKEPNDDCPRPDCTTPAGRGAGSANPQEEENRNPPTHPFPLQPGSPYLPGRASFRIKRQTNSVGTVDVLAEMNTLEITENVAAEHSRQSLASEEIFSDEDGLCLSPIAMGVFLALVSILTILAIGISFFLIFKK